MHWEGKGVGQADASVAPAPTLPMHPHLVFVRCCLANRSLRSTEGPPMQRWVGTGGGRGLSRLAPPGTTLVLHRRHHMFYCAVKRFLSGLFLWLVQKWKTSLKVRPGGAPGVSASGNGMQVGRWLEINGVNFSRPVQALPRWARMQGSRIWEAALGWLLGRRCAWCVLARNRGCPAQLSCAAPAHRHTTPPAGCQLRRSCLPPLCPLQRCWQRAASRGRGEAAASREGVCLRAVAAEEAGGVAAGSAFCVVPSKTATRWEAAAGGWTRGGA